MIFLIKSEYKESFWRGADARNVNFFLLFTVANLRFQLSCQR